MKNLIVGLFLCLLCSCADESIETPDTPLPLPAEPIELTVKQAEKASLDNSFSFGMFKEVSAMQGANTFFSPLSLNMALGMLYNGASGDTRSEMADALGIAGFTDAEVNEYYRKMMQALLSIDPMTDIGIANSIWYRDILPVKQPFIDINKDCFDAPVQALDFGKPDAANIINQWCAEKTNNRIREIIDDTGGTTQMILINAIYFKSQWQFAFEKALTKQDNFATAGNSEHDGTDCRPALLR